MRTELKARFEGVSPLELVMLISVLLMGAAVIVVGTTLAMAVLYACLTVGGPVTVALVVICTLVGVMVHRALTDADNIE